MKNDTKITLTLKQIKKLVKESAGTGKWWMDIPGAQYLWHGEWSDPEIIYKGFSLNYWDVEEGALDMYREEHPEDKGDKGFDEYFKTLGGDGGWLHGELEDLVYALLGDNGLDRKPWLGIKDANLVKEIGGKQDGEHVVYKGCLVDFSDFDYWDEEYGEFTSYSDDPEAFCEYYRGPMHRQELVDQLDKAVSQFVSESVKEDSLDGGDDQSADAEPSDEKPIKKWYGDTKCDFCHRDCGKTLYDGMTGMGPWAVMCEPCFHEYGVGLGPGKGQKYKKVGDEYIQVDDKRKSAAKKRASRRRDVSDWEREFFPELFSEGRRSKVTLDQLKKLVKESDGNGEGKQCRWVAWSDDGSYDDESDKTFEYEEDAYEDMAKNAVSKMLWNTEPSDFNDCDSIGYQVMFTPNAISHKSYSGTYVWAIIDEDKVLTDDEKREIEERVWRKKVRESVQDGDKEECTFSEFRKFAKSLGYKVASKTWDFGGFGYGSSRFYKVFSGDRLVHVLNPKKKDEYVSGWWDKAMELDPELQEFVLSHRIVDDRDPSVKCIPEG